jgi:hypothetical protein
MLPSGPAVMSFGKLKVGVTNSVMTPRGVMRATMLRFCSVNHMLPSGPRAISMGSLLELGIGKERTRGRGAAQAVVASANARSAVPRLSHERESMFDSQ